MKKSRGVCPASERQQTPGRAIHRGDVFSQRGGAARFFLSSRIFELLGEVLVKFDQNVPNLLRRDVRLIQLGINRHKNDVCGRSEVVYQAIARTFAFLNITVPHPHLEYGIMRSGYLVAYDLASL